MTSTEGVEQLTRLLVHAYIPDACKRGGDGKGDGAAKKGVGTDCILGGEVLRRDDIKKQSGIHVPSFALAMIATVGLLCVRKLPVRF